MEAFAPLPLQELHHYYAPSATSSAALVLSAFSFEWIFGLLPYHQLSSFSCSVIKPRLKFTPSLCRLAGYPMVQVIWYPYRKHTSEHLLLTNNVVINDIRRGGFNRYSFVSSSLYLLKSVVQLTSLTFPWRSVTVPWKESTSWWFDKSSCKAFAERPSAV